MSTQNKRFLNYINFSTTTFCFIGFSLALYSFLVELKFEMDPKYEAMCDINEHMSCTKAFSSPYGKGFGFVGKMFGDNSAVVQPNSLYGMTFYTVYFFINMVNIRSAANVMIYLAIVASLFSAYLAAVLVFILEDYCIVCISTYLVNAILLWLAVYKRRAVSEPAYIATKKNE